MDDDLFGDIPQPKRAPPPEAKRPLTADDIRARMLGLIAALRAAESNPFGAAEFAKHIAMFPIMAQWLPGDEGKQLCFEFDQEVERLNKAA